MKVIYPPNLIGKEGFKVFLAGTIDMGNSEDWQQKVIDEFRDIQLSKELIFLNPRRNNWDASWEQTIENKQFNEQVTWELDALEQCDLIVMFLEANSKSPISMLELGLFAGSNKILVCCENGFWRKGNIDIVCKRKNISSFEKLDDLLIEVKKKIYNNGLLS